MFQENEIVEVNLEGYRKWYLANVRSGVWLLEERLCYVTHTEEDGFVGFHELTGCIGGSCPAEFLTTTGEFYTPVEVTDPPTDVDEIPF